LRLESRPGSSGACTSGMIASTGLVCRFGL